MTERRLVAMTLVGETEDRIMIEPDGPGPIFVVPKRVWGDAITEEEMGNALTPLSSMRSNPSREKRNAARSKCRAAFNPEGESE